MLSRPLSILALGLTLAIATTAAAQAQSSQQPSQFGPRANKQAQPGGQPQPNPAEVVATHGAWKVQCEVLPKAGAEGQAEGQRSCGMVQSGQSEKNQKATLTLVLVKMKAGDKSQINMRVIAPIGVFLPTGVALEIDGNAVGRVPFTRCMPQICMAFAEATADTLGKMKKGNEANFIIYEAPGIGLPIKMSLEGFSAALAELDNL
jgi:invasion protein IalB